MLFGYFFYIGFYLLIFILLISFKKELFYQKDNITTAIVKKTVNSFKNNLTSIRITPFNDN